MHGHARRSGTDRYQQPADNPNDGFVVAVKTNAGQQGEAEAVGVDPVDARFKNGLVTGKRACRECAHRQHAEQTDDHEQG